MGRGRAKKPSIGRLRRKTTPFLCSLVASVITDVLFEANRTTQSNFVTKIEEARDENR